MPKYYIKCGTLEYIVSTNRDPFGAAIHSVWQTNDYDTLDEYFYVDERGMRNYISAEPDTNVFSTMEVLRRAGWTIN